MDARRGMCGRVDGIRKENPLPAFYDAARSLACVLGVDAVEELHKGGAGCRVLHPARRDDVVVPLNHTKRGNTESLIAFVGLTTTHTTKPLSCLLLGTARQTDGKQ